MSILQESPAESARFGVRIVRAGPVDAGDEDLAAEVTRARPDVVIVRLPAGRDAPRVPGYDTLDAGELVQWRGDLKRVVAPAAEAGIGSAALTPADAALAADLVRDVFAGHESHYSANPLLDDSLVADGYAEWATATIRAGGLGVVLHLEDRPIGVATASRLDARAWRIELAGIVADQRGRGRYAHLLHAVHTRTIRSGADSVVIATQASNQRVQRAWERAGYRPDSRWRTAHLVRLPHE